VTSKKEPEESVERNFSDASSDSDEDNRSLSSGNEGDNESIKQNSYRKINPQNVFASPSSSISTMENEFNSALAANYEHLFTTNASNGYNTPPSLDTSINNKKRKNEGCSDSDENPTKVRRQNAVWTPEEDELFIQTYKRYGKSWKAIHSVMQGKTREQVQSHGQYMIRTGKLEDIKPQKDKQKKNEKQQVMQNQIQITDQRADVFVTQQPVLNAPPLLL